TTNTGLNIQAELDKNDYKTGIKVREKDFNEVQIVREFFHGEWNYAILPQSTSK
ncbi:MAG: ISAzo13 family transposase, partial [Moorea sp. SIO3E2]|nr:ISAzo13 family transposase [Moorena sp. SIO3E2]